MTTSAEVHTGFSAWQCTDPLSPASHRNIVREMNLRGCKWDTQMGDVSTLAPFALVLPREEWRQLAALAEALSAELGALEHQLKRRADLWPQLGLPRALLAALLRDEPWTPTAARIIRYDFHPTEEAWRISEANSDVPGGLNESSTFTQLLAENFPDLHPAGDPLGELAYALVGNDGGTGRIALLSAPGYTEDLQNISGLAEGLKQHGVTADLARPEQLVWEDGHAFIRQNGRLQPIDGIYRFYQGEWLTGIPAETWRPLLRGGRTPVCNPAIAILSESKRLPLLWSELQPTPPDTWQKLLPENRPPAGVVWQTRTNWVLKPAYCNTGDTIIGSEGQSRRDSLFGMIQAFTHFRSWIAQKRFHPLTIATPHGPMHPCLGVYTINGVAAGIYGRMSPKPVIDYSARDVAILLRD